MMQRYWIGGAALLTLICRELRRRKSRQQDKRQVASRDLHSGPGADEGPGRHLGGGRQGRQADRQGRVGGPGDRGAAAPSRRRCFPARRMEMVSLYHRDGADLVMTHYCMLGNQPLMKADPNSPSNQICFSFGGWVEPGSGQATSTCTRRRCAPSSTRTISIFQALAGKGANS